MALIKHLESDNQKDLLRDFFEQTLFIIKTDSFKNVGSSVDDLRAWISQGGLSRVRYSLNKQRHSRGFPDKKKQTVSR